MCWHCRLCCLEPQAGVCAFCRDDVEFANCSAYRPTRAALASPVNGLIHPACSSCGAGLAGSLDRALLASSSPGSGGDARHQVHCHREMPAWAAMDGSKGSRCGNWGSGSCFLGANAWRKPEAQGRAICDLQQALSLHEGRKQRCPISATSSCCCSVSVWLSMPCEK